MLIASYTVELEEDPQYPLTDYYGTPEVFRERLKRSGHWIEEWQFERMTSLAFDFRTLKIIHKTMAKYGNHDPITEEEFDDFRESIQCDTCNKVIKIKNGEIAPCSNPFNWEEPAEEQPPYRVSFFLSVPSGKLVFANSLDFMFPDAEAVNGWGHNVKMGGQYLNPTHPVGRHYVAAKSAQFGLIYGVASTNKQKTIFVSTGKAKILIGGKRRKGFTEIGEIDNDAGCYYGCDYDEFMLRAKTHGKPSSFHVFDVKPGVYKVHTYVNRRRGDEVSTELRWVDTMIESRRTREE